MRVDRYTDPAAFWNDARRAPLYLYADASNPTANGIYRRIGFRKVGEHLHLTRAGA